MRAIRNKEDLAIMYTGEHILDMNVRKMDFARWIRVGESIGDGRRIESGGIATITRLEARHSHLSVVVGEWKFQAMVWTTPKINPTAVPT